MQRMNHFSGMLELCRKKSMARHLSSLAQKLPASYAFAPKTLCLPEQKEALAGELGRGLKKGAWIMKPDAGCQGKGIVLVQTAKQLDAVRFCWNVDRSMSFPISQSAAS